MAEKLKCIVQMFQKHFVKLVILQDGDKKIQMLFQKEFQLFVFWLSPRGESTANNIFQHNCFPAV